MIKVRTVFTLKKRVKLEIEKVETVRTLLDMTVLVFSMAVKKTITVIVLDPHKKSEIETLDNTNIKLCSFTNACVLHSNLINFEYYF